MEIQVIIGPNGSGKSLYAESAAVKTGSPLVYLATMVPQTQDNLARIEKHRLQRRDKGFRTVEQPWQIQEIAVKPEEVVLLEDASNLLANGIFAYGGTGEQALEQIVALAAKYRKLIVVSIQGLMEEGYDVETAAYIRSLNTLNAQLVALASSAQEMHDGVAVPMK